MSIIYSYPEQTALNDNDTLLGTSAALVGGKKKNITRNFSLSELNTYFGVGSIINPIASDFKLAVFNQGGTKITDSIISQDALAGTSVTIAGNLTANTTTLNGFLTVNGGANLGTGAAGELIAFGSTTRLNAPIQDQLGVVGALDQILISDTAGRVSWQNYTSGLTYTGTWDAANNITAPQGVPLVSSIGTNGEFYIVTVAGNTQLNGQPVTPTTPPYWNVGDWVVFVENGAAGVWQKIDNTSVLTGTGTDNKIAMWTGGATPSVTLTDSLISQDAGATTVTVAGAFTSTGNINGVNITGTGDLSGVNLLLTGTVSLNAQLGNPGQVLTSQGTADAIWANPTPVNNITGSGTANTLSMFTGQYTVGDSAVTQSADALTVDVLTKTVSDASAYTINTNIGKLTRTGIFPGAGALTSNVTIGAQYTYGNVDMYGSQMELHTYNAPGYSGSPITLWSSSTSGIGISLRTDGGSITNVAGTYNIQATGAGSGASPEAIQISSNTGIKFEGQGNAANINFRSYNTNLLDSGDINFISETQEGQAGNVSFSSIATDANGTAGEIRLAGAGISTSATDAVPLGLVIASNGHVKTGSVGDTYTLGSSTDGSNVKLNLDAANGTDSAVTLTGAGGLTIAQTNDIVTLTAPAGSDTTYTLAAGAKTGTSVPLNLSPSTGSDTTVNLTDGTGITLTRNAANQVTIATTAAIGNFLPLAGGTMTGVISMGSDKITNVDDPTNPQDAATKQYVDDSVVGGLIYQGGYNASANTPVLDNRGTQIAVSKGWTYTVTADGTFYTETVKIGDVLIAEVDIAAGAGALTDWTTVQSNIDVASATVQGIANFPTGNNQLNIATGSVTAKTFGDGSSGTSITGGYVPNATSAAAGTFLKKDGTWAVAGTGTVTSVDLSTNVAALAVTSSPVTGSGTLTLNRNGGTTGQYIDGASGAWTDLPAPGTGTVTDVGLTMPAAFSVTNSPITSSGNLAVTPTGGGAGQFLDYTGNWSSPGGGVSSVSFNNAISPSNGDALTITPTTGSVVVSANVFAGNGMHGIVSSGSSGNDALFLKGDGSWDTPGGAGATITTQTAVGNGTNLTFALGATPNGSSVNFVDAFIDGVYQEVSTYSISGTNLVFNTGNAPAAGTNVETKTTADYNVAAVVTTASLGQTNTTGNVNLRIIPNYIISNITAQANNLYIFDSTTQAYTLTLPSSPQPGDSIKISVRGGLATNVLAVPVTENIMGGVLGVGLAINNATAAFEIIYSGDSTKQGWVIIGNV